MDVGILYCMLNYTLSIKPGHIWEIHSELYPIKVKPVPWPDKREKFIQFAVFKLVLDFM